MLEENKALVRRYYEQVTGDLSEIDQIVAPTFVDHHFPPEIQPGPAGVTKFFTEFIAGIFSDVRIELDFLYSLRSGDRFFVGINTERISRLRFGFHQDIYRLPDDKPILREIVIGTAVNDRGKPMMPKELERLLISEPA